MIKVMIICLLAFTINSCFAQKTVEWIIIKKAQTITPKNAKKVKKFKNTPESILSYFYASKVRGDEKWLQVTPISRSQKLEFAIKKYENWSFTKIKLLKKKQVSPKKLWVKIFMEIEHQGKTESGEDEALLEFIDGKWIIATLPS